MGYSPLPIDETTGAAVSLDLEHHEIHEGDSYVAFYSATGVGVGSNVDVRITAPNTTTRIHFVFEVIGTVEYEVLWCENGNVTSGTSVTAYNRERNSANTATLVVAHTPSVVSVGTQIDGWRVGLGKTGGEVRGLSEWVLTQGYTYLLRVTSQAASNNISVHMDWYEED